MHNARSHSGVLMVLQLGLAHLSIAGLLGLISDVGADDYALLGDAAASNGVRAEDGMEKRAWNNFAAGYGKRSGGDDYYDDDFGVDTNDLAKRAWNSGFAGSMGKRAWNSGFSGAMGKRAWNSGFAGSMGKRAAHNDLKRAWNSGFAGSMGKRAWNSGFAGAMGKRAWNSGFAGAMGKRAWNSGFAGAMGKRMVENFQDTANEPAL